MAITFAVRGDSLDARYSVNGKSPAVLGVAGNAPPEVNSDDTDIGGNNTIDMAGAFLTYRGLLYPGDTNTPSGIARSILMRVKFASHGSNQGLFFLGGSVRNPFNSIGAYINNTGDVYTQVYNQIFQNDQNIATSTGITNVADEGGSAVFHDLVWTWTGDTSADGFNFYVDGSLIATDTLTRSLESPFDANVRRGIKSISIGSNFLNSDNTHYTVSEFVVWDEIIDPTSVSLTSGTGSLNGSSRTAYVDVTALDGENNTFPTEVQVESGVTWIQEGVEKTGTLATPTLPEENDVRLGVEYGQAGALKTGALNTNTSNAYEVEVQSNEIEVKVKSNG